MTEALIRNPQGFSYGFTALISSEDASMKMNFGILKLKKDESFLLHSPLESACLLLTGTCVWEFFKQSRQVKRKNLFDENPFALHLPPNESATIRAIEDSEFVLIQTENDKIFEPSLFDHTNMLESEQRGKDILSDTSYRIVRTIFDIRNRPRSNLVLGEVITLPGRWSSYPPHHHPQPEIYHYRFSEPQGFGHGEVGENVYKIKQFDTLKIQSGKDHAQTAAPGYAMMYIWAIRHLPNNPYKMPEFTKEHEWTRFQDANQRVWQPKKS